MSERSESGFFTRGQLPPADAPGRSRIDKFRAIVREGCPMSVEGHLVDVTAASSVVRVYDALKSAENRHTLMSPLSLLRVIDIATKLLQKVA